MAVRSNDVSAGEVSRNGLGAAEQGRDYWRCRSFENRSCSAADGVPGLYCAGLAHPPTRSRLRLDFFFFFFGRVTVHVLVPSCFLMGSGCSCSLGCDGLDALGEEAMKGEGEITKLPGNLTSVMSRAWTIP